MINHVADDLLFILENDSNPAAHVSGPEILHAVDEKMSDRLRLGPEGSTKADAWIARHGNPMANTDAALLFLNHLVGIPSNLPIGMVVSREGCTVRIGQGSSSVQVQGNLPVALCAAGLAYHVKVRG